jgi:hypothetical protein
MGNSGKIDPLPGFTPRKKVHQVSFFQQVLFSGEKE